MKNLWLTILCLMPLALTAASEEQPISATQGVKKALGAALGGVTKMASSVKKPDAADVTVYSMPLWFAHGLHGYKQRWNETHMWDATNFKYDKNPKAPQYRHFYNRLFAGDLARFSWYHPIQSLKGNVVKCPPVLGSIVASVATGYCYNMATDYTYSKWYKSNFKKAK